MKTTEQINQIKTLKGFIAELVTKHKEKKSTDHSSYVLERPKLFILYQAYYVLRHEVSDIRDFVKQLEQSLKPWKRNRDWPIEKFGVKLPGESDWHCYACLAEAIESTIKHLEKYVESKSE